MKTQLAKRSRRSSVGSLASIRRRSSTARGQDRSRSGRGGGERQEQKEGGATVADRSRRSPDVASPLHSRTTDCIRTPRRKRRTGFGGMRKRRGQTGRCEQGREGATRVVEGEGGDAGPGEWAEVARNRVADRRRKPGNLRTGFRTCLAGRFDLDSGPSEARLGGVQREPRPFSSCPDERCAIRSRFVNTPL